MAEVVDEDRIIAPNLASMLVLGQMPWSSAPMMMLLDLG